MMMQILDKAKNINFVIRYNHYTKIAVVCLSVCHGGQRKTLDLSESWKPSLFLCKATGGRYIKESTDIASKNASSRLKEARTKK